MQKILFEDTIFVEKIRDRFAYGVFFRNKNHIRVNFQKNFDLRRYFLQISTTNSFRSPNSVAFPAFHCSNGTDVADDARIDFAFLLDDAFRAKLMFADEIAMRRADAESGSKSKIWKRIFFGNVFHQFFGRFDVLNPLAQKSMKNRSAGIFRLERLLKFKGFKKIFGDSRPAAGSSSCNTVRCFSFFRLGRSRKSYPDIFRGLFWPDDRPFLRPA